MSEQDRSSIPEGKGQLEREAAQWCVRMHGEGAEQQRSAFEDWLRRGALHRQAYNRIEEVYVLGGRLRRSNAPHTTIEPTTPAGAEHRPQRRLFAGVAALAVLTIGGATSYFLQSRTKPAQPPIIALDGGAKATISTSDVAQDFALVDGSRVTLAPASMLTLSFDPRRRNLSLLSGTGRFSVAHERRPFVVFAKGGTVTATGTMFEVSIRRTTVDVHLIEGSVAVAPAATGGRGAPKSPRRLQAGDRISFASAPSPTLAQSAQAAAPLAPQPRTVGELVDRANADARDGPHIEISEQALRDTRLSGTFQVHDPETTAERLSVMFNLHLDRSQPGILRLSRRVAR